MRGVCTVLDGYGDQQQDNRPLTHHQHGRLLASGIQCEPFLTGLLCLFLLCSRDDALPRAPALGWIPPELMELESLTTLRLYRNFGISGEHHC